MVYDDYSINLTTYGDYNVWISNRDENGFWVETNAEKEWSFDWNVIGGRKDATNIIRAPKACVITPISLDHQEFLGSTLSKIAYEKWKSIFELSCILLLISFFL